MQNLVSTWHLYIQNWEEDRIGHKIEEDILDLIIELIL